MKIDSIRRYIQQEILDDESIAIELDEDLMLSGALDSSSVMQLIAHIEECENIEVDSQDVVPENFGSLRKIEVYLAGRGIDV